MTISLHAASAPLHNALIVSKVHLSPITMSPRFSRVHGAVDPPFVLG